MNEIYKNSQIITALATPYGKSALAVIRVTGQGCIELVNRYLSRELVKNEIKLNVFKAKSFTERLMAVCFASPNTYTGEDTVELYPHGNPVICDGIIETLIKGGARLAERGEFTKRAFLNGKTDLMRCEALADIIDAQTTESLVYGNERYDERFDGLKKVKKLLENGLSTIEAMIHYSDELEQTECDDSALQDVYALAEMAADILKRELDCFAGGRIINDGFKVTLIGAPNVGKSTLLNALVGTDKAIVTSIAGTTRDAIDGEYIYKGRKFVITDTAGLNDAASDEVEKIGIERAKKSALNADAAVYVAENGKSIKKLGIKCDVTVINKCDGINDVGEEHKKASNANGLKISAKNGINITALKQLLYELCPKDHGAICNHRQYDCAKRCSDSLEAIRTESKKAGGAEIVAALMYEGYRAIAELFGEVADEKIISAVFDRFCVGK